MNHFAEIAATKYDSNHRIEEVSSDAAEDIESNYITNGSYAQGIPSMNRGMLD